MAELVVALGAVAAALQLCNYGYKGLTATSALSHRVRHSERIRVWIEELAAATQLLDLVEQSPQYRNPIVADLVASCREDTLELERSFQAFPPGSNIRRLDALWFVWKKGPAINSRLSSLETTLRSLARVPQHM